MSRLDNMTKEALLDYKEYTLKLLERIEVRLRVLDGRVKPCHFCGYLP